MILSTLYSPIFSSYSSKGLFLISLKISLKFLVILDSPNPFVFFLFTEMLLLLIIFVDFKFGYEIKSRLVLISFLSNIIFILFDLLIDLFFSSYFFLNKFCPDISILDSKLSFLCFKSLGGSLIPTKIYLTLFFLLFMSLIKSSFSFSFINSILLKPKTEPIALLAPVFLNFSLIDFIDE